MFSIAGVDFHEKGTLLTTLTYFSFLDLFNLGCPPFSYGERAREKIGVRPSFFTPIIYFVNNEDLTLMFRFSDR